VALTDGNGSGGGSSSPPDDGDCALDLSPHCAPRGLAEAAARGLPPPRYRLVSVVRHCGASLHGGHYTAVGRGGGGEGGDGSGGGAFPPLWFARDDDLVWPCAPPCGGARERDAYVLVFELKEE
jgi:ubiquitin C-terminal hydrolase